MEFPPPPSSDPDIKDVGTEVFTAVKISIAFFWVMAPCSPVDAYNCFRGTYYLRLQNEEL
jgi:hypothetical protein